MRQILFLIGLLTVIILLTIGCKPKENSVTKTETPIKTKSDIEKRNDTVKQDGKRYAVSVYFTPILNTKNFSSVYGGKSGMTLKRSKNGLINELETVAYPGTVFEILEEYPIKDHFIYKVFTKEYDVKDLDIELFIDSRFIEMKTEKPEDRKIKKPTVEEIFKFFDNSIGALYVWGANNLNGVPKMLDYYKPSGELGEKEEKEWMMKGTDCSGLLYEATNGMTVRNTHDLVYYGDAVKIAGMSVDEIADIAEPLDLIVWKGHIIYVYDKNTTIESSFSAGGVVKKNLRSVLRKLTSERKPVNEWNDNGGKQFVLRRWVKLLN